MNRYQVFYLIFLMLLACSQEKTTYGKREGHYITILNTKIYFEESGSGAALLLLDGGGIDRSIQDFAKCIPGLSRHGYRIIAMDTPGQGKSALPDTLSYTLLTQFASAFIDSLAIDSVYVMGWSDGGIVALLLAEQRPDKVKKVIAVGANNGLKGAMHDSIDISTVIPQSLTEFEKNNTAVIAAYQQILPRDWKQLMNDLNAMWYQAEYFSPSILQRINIPVMIVQGDNDIMRPEHSIDLHRQIRNSALCILPNTTHEVFTEKPDLINSITVDFFR